MRMRNCDKRALVRLLLRFVGMKSANIKANTIRGVQSLSASMSAIQILQSALALIILCASTRGTEAQGVSRECPRPVCPSDAQIKALQNNCSSSLIWEITGYCRVVCPKQLGDTCGGRCGQEGICIDDGSVSDEGVKCSISLGNLERDSTLTDVGRCVRKCQLNYTLAETGVCVPQCQQDYVLDSNGACVPKLCLKNCSEYDITNVCGSDGRWYKNLCYLRQQKLCYNRNVSPSNVSICNSACIDLTAPDNGYFTLSNHLLPGSVASFICNDGFMLDRSVTPVCQGSGLGWSLAPPSCIIPPCSNQPCNNVRLKCVNTFVDNDIGYVANCVCKDSSDCPTSNLSEATMVCGSDGTTYLSQCLFYVAACQKSNVRIAYNGRCRKRRTSVPAAPAMQLQSRS